MKKTLLYCVVAFLAGLGLVYAVRTVTGSGENTDNTLLDSNIVLTSGTPSPVGPETPGDPTLAAIWIPGTDDKLHPLPLEVEGGGQPDVVTALNELVRLAPKYYPKGTKILDFSQDGKHYTIDVNKAFFTSTFWSRNGELTTELALYALVNSASKVPVVSEGVSPEVTPEGTPSGTPEGTPSGTPEATPGDTSEGTPVKTLGAPPEATPGSGPSDDSDGPTVTFTIEGKPASSLTLGEFDLTDPLPAEPKLESKTPFESHDSTPKLPKETGTEPTNATPEATTEATAEPTPSTAP